MIIAASLPVRECGLKLFHTCRMILQHCHSPCGSVDWNPYLIRYIIQVRVTPRAGVWIEMGRPDRQWGCHAKSLPVRECGLKLKSMFYPPAWKVVTPRAGVWIEITIFDTSNRLLRVTPRAGVWIEIRASSRWLIWILSLPVRECGLKFYTVDLTVRYNRHSPCGSVDWNTSFDTTDFGDCSHSPCGSVDWNRWYLNIGLISQCHSPCGSVDWNKLAFYHLHV